MKPILTGACCILFCLWFNSGFGQQLPVTEPDYNKPKLFAPLPAAITIDTSVLIQLFSYAEGQQVDVAIGSYRYKGIVISKSGTATAAVQSVVIKSSNFSGSAFTFSKIIVDGAVVFKGRILSRQHSDAFELQQQNGQYILQKKHQLNIINE